MRPRTYTVKTNPGIVKWVVDTSGLEISSIAKRLRVSESTVLGWTRESHEISIAKLENLSTYVKRPLAVFLLDSPPYEPALPDYRGAAAKITQNTALAVRTARYLQEAAKDMMHSLGEDPSPNIRPDVTVRQSPEKTAAEERARLRLDERHSVVGSRDRARRLYRILREAVESLNIPVFQQSAELGEMRGLSLSGDPCAILINSKDTAEDRMFTLVHEYGHILLRKGGLCAPRVGDRDVMSAEQKIESWCNRFASFALMPRTAFREEYQRLEKDESDRVKTIECLARKFATGKQATAVHARELGLDARGFTDGARQVGGGRRCGGAVPLADKCISERGRKFTSLVLSAKQAGAISSRDVADYLDMGLEHVPELREKLCQA